jgi:hypothetical protein
MSYISGDFHRATRISNPQKNLASEIRNYYVEAETVGSVIIQDLDTLALQQNIDQPEFEKMARCLGRLMHRWRRSTTMSVETVTELTEQLQRELKLTKIEECRLQEVDMRLRKCIAENTNLRCAIQQLEEILETC